MRSLFANQMDFVFLVYGLSFVLLAGVCVVAGRKERGGDGLPWRWLALFGISHGVNEWLHMLVASLGDTPVFSTVRLGGMILSFVFLTEFGRRGLGGLWGTWRGVFAHAGLLLTVGVALAGGDVNSMDAISRLALGFVGALLASAALYRHAGRCGKSGLLTASAAMALYAVAAGVITPKTSFPPGSLVNTDIFAALAGFPVQWARGALAVMIACGVWSYYYQTKTRASSAGPSRSERALNHYGPLCLIAAVLPVLVVGWIASYHSGDSEAAEWR